jgi:hypothetical protein
MFIGWKMHLMGHEIGHIKYSALSRDVPCLKQGKWTEENPNVGASD